MPRGALRAAYLGGLSAGSKSSVRARSLALNPGRSFPLAVSWRRILDNGLVAWTRTCDPTRICGAVRPSQSGRVTDSG